MSDKFLRGAKKARFFFLRWTFTCIARTFTFFLLKIRGTLILFRLNAQPILQNFPNKGSVETQISRLFALTSFARKSCVEAFRRRLWCNSACAIGSRFREGSLLARRTVKADRKAIRRIKLRLWTAQYYNQSINFNQ